MLVSVGPLTGPRGSVARPALRHTPHWGGETRHSPQRPTKAVLRMCDGPSSHAGQSAHPGIRPAVQRASRVRGWVLWLSWERREKAKCRDARRSRRTARVDPATRRWGATRVNPSPPGRNLQMHMGYILDDGPPVLGSGPWRRDPHTGVAVASRPHSPHPGADPCPWGVLLGFPSEPDQ